MMKTTEHTMPFGKHRDKPLAEVPSDYLLWVFGECKLSSGLRAAVEDELRRRNVATAPAPELRLIPECLRCGNLFHVCRWQTCSDGRRVIRASCAECGHFITFAPITSPYVEEAGRHEEVTT
jgi:hypothetical protein